MPVWHCVHFIIIIIYVVVVIRLADVILTC